MTSDIVFAIESALVDALLPCAHSYSADYGSLFTHQDGMIFSIRNRNLMIVGDRFGSMAAGR